MVCPFKPPRHVECQDRIECRTCKGFGHEGWCASLCHDCENNDCTCGALDRAMPRPPRQRIDLWNTPTSSSGRFEEEKRRGDVLAGVRKEDALFEIPDDLTKWWALRWLRVFFR